MSRPTQTCRLCGRRQVVTPDGRGFPPDIAKRRLQKACEANGCPSKPVYRAGLDPVLEALLRHSAITEARASVALGRDQTHSLDDRGEPR